MFRPDKEDGLFTLDSIFLLIKDNIVFLLTFENQSDTTKGLRV